MANRLHPGAVRRYDLYTSSYLKGATANLVGGGIDVGTVRLQS